MNRPSRAGPLGRSASTRGARLRAVISLPCLKHAFDESGKALLEFRQLFGAEAMEELLTQIASQMKDRHTAVYRLRPFAQCLRRRGRLLRQRSVLLHG